MGYGLVTGLNGTGDRVTGGTGSRQTVQSIDVPGARLVPDTSVAPGANSGIGVGARAEIRLTYDQLTALVEAAVKEITQ